MVSETCLNWLFPFCPLSLAGSNETNRNPMPFPFHTIFTNSINILYLQMSRWEPSLTQWITTEFCAIPIYLLITSRNPSAYLQVQDSSLTRNRTPYFIGKHVILFCKQIPRFYTQNVPSKDENFIRFNQRDCYTSLQNKRTCYHTISSE